MDQEALRFRIETEPEKLIRELNQDAPIFQMGFGKRYLRQLREDAFPDVPAPDNKTREQRQKDQELLSQKIHDIQALHTAIYDAYRDPSKQVARFMSQMPDLMIPARRDYSGRRITSAHEGGLEALNSIVSGAGVQPDAEKIQGMLEDYGLIPKGGDPRQDFDYDAAISDFNDKYAYTFDPAETAAAQRRYQAFTEEFGLDYDDLRELAANRNISVDEYVRRATEENRRAEQAAQPAQATLDEVRERLGNENIGRLSGEEMCGTFRDLNRISAENRTDAPTVTACAAMMKRLYLHMNAYEKQHPAFTKEKDRYLKKQDYLDAKETIRRGDAAAGKQRSQPEAQQDVRKQSEQPKREAPGMRK